MPHWNLLTKIDQLRIDATTKNTRILKVLIYSHFEVFSFKCFFHNFKAEIRRKSNCVKEIEKIQKNREQRRAKQEEKRQKISETDTTVPAYEFAQMIRYS